MSNFKESMIIRLDKRLETMKNRVESVKNTYLKNINFDETDAGESERIWLDQFAVGKGLDVCCGDFLVGDAYGVDGDSKALGVDLISRGDSLSLQKSGELDFIVTNYLDGFSDPIKTLNEWWRCLKVGGTLAVVCRNSEIYKDSLGPLANGKRGSCYTDRILTFYLTRAGFKVTSVDKSQYGNLRALAKKC